ncbi:hypothetical protein SLEP1_g31941 [Rubroshorea leprosula]|uniref:Leucine-rich repeat-containing N-terminal plant-type domain-containing protein n=1 Tax=Rubroshorea leprosula TaxID=152421 RepID=A0AAV5KBS0_9ROSI|nr:hypothetical protein SLEP1_g31941 [Rubroshorea leprosula]
MTLSFFSWLFMSLLATIFFEINVDLVSAHCQSDQQGLLLQFKNRLNFNSSLSLKLVKWNQSLDCCMWEGVTCDVKGRVTDLDLSNERIFYGIDNSSSLFNLQHLQSLNLAYNGFNSTFPSGFDKLAKLSNLNLSHAGFIGQIPLEISRMTSLVTLDLSVDDHGLELENPNLVILVQNLKELKHLFLDGINLSTQGKEWCQVLSSLSNLQVLSMSNCYLSGPIDSSLSKLQSLSVIRLDGNNLSAQFPKEIFQVRTIKALNLSNNPFLEGSLKEFLPDSSLETLLLSKTHFGGTLPESIGNLGKLSWIELVGCQFNGSIPEAMANLTQLVFLDFSWNNFFGPIPSFSLAKNLTQLNIANNHLTGSILSTNWSSLSKLINIDLSNNSLNGTLPTSLFGNPSLRSIALSQNQFSGRLNDPLEVSSSTLHVLDLGGNKLEGPVPEFVFGVQSLYVLILSSNNFSGPLNISSCLNLLDLSILDLSFNNFNAIVSNPDSDFPLIGQLKLASCKLTSFPNFLKQRFGLTHLDLSNNQMDGEIPNWVWNLDLDHLDLSHNYLVNFQEPIHVASYLSFLDLHGNKLQGQIPKPFSAAMYIDYSSNNFSSIPIDIGDSLMGAMFFSLSNNNLHGIIPESICNSTPFVLDLSNNSLNGTMPQCLTRMKNLRVLDLSRNNLSGNIPDTFSSDCWIETLDLNGNHLEGKIPRSLANCTSLKVLDLGNNQINDTFPCHLKNISSLKVLQLRGELPFQWLRSWKAMMVGSVEFKILTGGNGFSFTNSLYVDGHNYSVGVAISHQDSVTITNKGSEISLVKITSLFTFIDLSCNKFEGQIPELLGEFKALYALNLSHNGFKGLIPTSLGNLKNLESLDLSSNNLSGGIPQQLGDLNFLAILNLSHNHLEGRIPNGGQIQTFSEDFFKDNKGLCGVPLKKNCSSNVGPTTKDKHSDDGTNIDWNFLSVELGFIFGLGIVILPLMFYKRWRLWYCKRINGFLSRFFPQLIQRSRNRGRRASRRRTKTQLRNNQQ